MRHRFCLLMAALWWGSLSGLAFLVVPQLFMHLATPATAGAMAARLFTAQAWLGTACAMLMLMALNRPADVPAEVPADAPAGDRATFQLIIAGLLLALLVEFGVAPRIVNARADGGNLRLWHALGTAMYFAQWLCAGLSLWRLSRRPGTWNQPA